MPAERRSAAPGADVSAAGPAITYSGIGDEAGPTLADQVGAIQELGWPAIELRTVDRVAIADLTADAFARVVTAVGAAGLAVSCVDSRIGNWGRTIATALDEDIRELDVLGRRCAELGTRFVRVMSYPNAGLDPDDWGRLVIDRMRILAEHAEQLGLVLLHENCAGWAGRSGPRMLRMIHEVDSPALRLLFDTGNGIAYGYDAFSLLETIVDQVAYVHVKDGVGDTTGQEYTLPGAGRCRLADCLGLLLRRGFTGTWSIEPHVLLRPHDGHDRTAEVDGVAEFVAYGRRLERLVRQEILTAGRAS
ncbi:MAG TPA: sugar phosphate isomerase/epimerase family protein [Planosporangium sp.]|jgi:sugar phosphate isomerase/epimerase|nr:sugar phosphate isomerase/epimerase family protein [Planosporangium sp.]